MGPGTGPATRVACLQIVPHRRGILEPELWRSAASGWISSRPPTAGLGPSADLGDEEVWPSSVRLCRPRAAKTTMPRKAGHGGSDGAVGPSMSSNSEAFSPSWTLDGAVPSSPRGWATNFVEETWVSGVEVGGGDSTWASLQGNMRRPNNAGSPPRGPVPEARVISR